MLEEKKAAFSAYYASLQSCPTLRDPRNQTGVSCIAGGFFTNWAIRDAQHFKKQKCNWNAKNWFLQGVEKVLLLIECVKKCKFLWSFAKFYVEDFLLDDVPWSSRPVEVDSDQIETLLRTINVIPHMWWSTNSKYLNQELKIICTSLVSLITFIFGFHIVKRGKKAFLTIFVHAVL